MCICPSRPPRKPARHILCGILKIQQTSEYNLKRSRLTDLEDEPLITIGEREGKKGKIEVGDEEEQTIMYKRKYCMPWEIESIFYNNYAMLCLVTQLCLTLCDPMDYSPPCSSVHGILQARIPAWIAILFSMGSSWPRDWTHISWVSCMQADSILGMADSCWCMAETITILWSNYPPIKSKIKL